ncbi:MAG: addiction module protein [Proteobacteria bacterium]|nr:addiction module protein [Pseudomonadota bacterium]
MGDPNRPDFGRMSTAEQIAHVQDLWDQIASDPDLVPVTDAQRQELDRRLAVHEAGVGNTSEWTDVRARSRSTE